MNSIPFEKILEKVPGKYSLVRLACLRMQEIIVGEKPLVDTTHKKLSSVVLEEILQDKVCLELKTDESEESTEA